MKGNGLRNITLGRGKPVITKKKVLASKEKAMLRWVRESTTTSLNRTESTSLNLIVLSRKDLGLIGKNLPGERGQSAISGFRGKGKKNGGGTGGESTGKHQLEFLGGGEEAGSFCHGKVTIPQTEGKFA